MPELAEVEAYRRLAAGALGRRVDEVVAPDAWYLRGGLTATVLSDALVGRRLVDARRVGPDALTVTAADLTGALSASQAPLKARLLDQARLAGIGNLAADEILYQAGLDPGRPAKSLSPTEILRLHEHLIGSLAGFITGGGSHTGELQPQRRPGGMCPRDGTPLVRRTVGGRTTWSCPKHQR